MAVRSESSTRAVALNVYGSQQTIWRVLNGNFFHPFHFQEVQTLNKEDYPLRLNVYQWVLQQDIMQPDSQILCYLQMVRCLHVRVYLIRRIPICRQPIFPKQRNQIITEFLFPFIYFLCFPVWNFLNSKVSNWRRKFSKNFFTTITKCLS